MDGHTRPKTVRSAYSVDAAGLSAFSLGSPKRRKKHGSKNKKGKTVAPSDSFLLLPVPQFNEQASGQTVYVVDPRRLFCESISHRLQTFMPSLRVRGSDNILEVQEELPTPGLVLLSSFTAQLEEKSSQVEIAKVRKRFAPLPVILITDLEEVTLSHLALRSGFRGCFPATLGVELLASAVHLVLAGGTFVPPKLLYEWVRTDQTVVHN